MPGPGEHVADATEGIVDPSDLPKPKIQLYLFSQLRVSLQIAF